MKQRGEPIVMVTAYDAPSGRIADDAGVDLILVGDSAAMVMLGHDSTVPATIDEMIILTRAVTRGARRPLVDRRPPVRLVPGLRRARRSRTRSGSSRRRAPTRSSSRAPGRSLSRVRAIVGAGIPVMGHIGLTPQTATALGGFKAQGRTADAGSRSSSTDARALEAAGCFSIVLEAVPAPVAAEITGRSPIPTIGIGAGAGSDGQVLVWHDLLGLYDGHSPRFVKHYADLATIIRDAVAAYADDVRERRFPEEEHTYAMSEEELEAFRGTASANRIDSSRAVNRCSRPPLADSRGCARVPSRVDDR